MNGRNSSNIKISGESQKVNFFKKILPYIKISIDNSKKTMSESSYSKIFKYQNLRVDTSIFGYFSINVLSDEDHQIEFLKDLLCDLDKKNHSLGESVKYYHRQFLLKEEEFSKKVINDIDNKIFEKEKIKLLQEKNKLFSENEKLYIEKAQNEKFIQQFLFIGKKIKNSGSKFQRLKTTKNLEIIDSKGKEKNQSFSLNQNTNMKLLDEISDIFDNLNKSISELRDQNEILSLEKVNMEDEIEGFTKEIAQLKDHINNLESEQSNPKSSRSNNSNHHQQTSKTAIHDEKNERSSRNSGNLLERTKILNEKLEKDLEESQKAYAELNEKVSTLMSDKSLLNEKLTIALEENTNKEKLITELKQKSIELNEKSRGDNEKVLSDLHGQINSLSLHMKEMQDKHNSDKDKREKIREEETQLKAKLLNLEEKLNKEIEKKLKHKERATEISNHLEDLERKINDNKRLIVKEQQYSLEVSPDNEFKRKKTYSSYCIENSITQFFDSEKKVNKERKESVVSNNELNVNWFGDNGNNDQNPFIEKILLEQEKVKQSIINCINKTKSFFEGLRSEYEDNLTSRTTKDDKGGYLSHRSKDESLNETFHIDKKLTFVDDTDIMEDTLRVKTDSSINLYNAESTSTTSIAELKRQRNLYKKKYEESLAQNIQQGVKTDAMVILKQAFEKLILNLEMNSKIKEIIKVILRVLDYKDNEINYILENKTKKKSFLSGIFK